MHGTMSLKKVTLQLTSDWYEINQLVLKNNKKFAVNFSCTKTATHTLNITLDNQNLTLIESTNFLGTHLDINLLWTIYGKIIEGTEYSMQFDEEFILLSDSRLIKNSLFCTLSVIAVDLVVYTTERYT